MAHGSDNVMKRPFVVNELVCVCVCVIYSGIGNVNEREWGERARQKTG